MLEGITRIPPVDIETLPPDLREVLAEQRKHFGAPLHPNLFYARNPAYFGAARAMWTVIQQATERVPGTLKSTAQPPCCLVEWLRVLNGLQGCRWQQTWRPE